jgi:hypothetical protein
MKFLAPYLIVYFLGIATPILLVKEIFSRRLDDDGGESCILSLILWIIFFLIAAIAYYWVRSSYPEFR